MLAEAFLQSNEDCLWKFLLMGLDMPEKCQICRHKSFGKVETSQFEPGVS